jgi:hypothetical protein
MPEKATTPLATHFERLQGDTIAEMEDLILKLDQFKHGVAAYHKALETESGPEIEGLDEELMFQLIARWKCGQ